MQTKAKFRYLSLSLSPLLILSPIAVVASCNSQPSTPSAYEAQRLSKIGTLSFKSGLQTLSPNQLESLKSNPQLGFDLIKGFNFNDFDYQINRVWENEDGIIGFRKNYLKLELKITNKNDANDVSTLKEAKIRCDQQAVDPRVETLANTLDQLLLELNFNTIDQVNIKTINNWLNYLNNDQSQVTINQKHQKILKALFKQVQWPQPQQGLDYIISDLTIQNDQLAIQFQVYLTDEDHPNDLAPLMMTMIKRFDLTINQTINHQWQSAIFNQIVKNQWLQFNEAIYDFSISEPTVLFNTNFADLISNFLANPDPQSYQMTNWNDQTTKDPSDQKLIHHEVKFQISQGSNWTSDLITLNYDEITF